MNSRHVSQDVLDAQQSVVLGDTLTACGGTSLDLARSKSDDKVSDEGVLGLSATVRNHDAPAVGLRELSTEKENYLNNLAVLKKSWHARLDGL